MRKTNSTAKYIFIAILTWVELIFVFTYFFFIFHSSFIDTFQFTKHISFVFTLTLT